MRVGFNFGNQRIVFESELVIKLQTEELFRLNKLALLNVNLLEIKPEAKFLFRSIELLSVAGNELNIEFLTYISKIQFDQALLKVSLYVNLTIDARLGEDLEIEEILAPLGPFQIVSLDLCFVYKRDIPSFELDCKSFQRFTKWHDNLTHLMLYGLEVKRIGSASFSLFSNLTSLYLSCMELAEIDVDAFQNCQNLEVLNLRNNKLELIPSGTFDPLAKLRALYVKNNLLRDIEPGTFLKLANLTKFELCGNPLREDLHEDTSSGLMNLAELWIGKTPLFRVFKLSVADHFKAFEYQAFT